MLKKIISLLIAFLMLLTFPLNVFADTNDYSNHWASNVINKWKIKEIVKGYNDGVLNQKMKLHVLSLYKY